MKFSLTFSQVFRWLTAAFLFFTSWAILLERWLWNKVPTQISATVVYVILALNVVTLAALVAKPSALGLSTKTDKN